MTLRNRFPAVRNDRPARRHRAGAVLLTAASAGLLAACGNGGGGTGPSPRPPASATAASATAASPGPGVTASPAGISVRSPAFAAGSPIPARYSCRGGNTPPPLTWTGLPAGTASVAVVMDDPDAVGGTYTHWVVFNLPATATGLSGGQLPARSAQASNSGGQAGYIGPCPPSGTHHYRFTVYAERRRLPLPAGAGLTAALAAIRSDAIASGRLTGVFSAG